MTSHDSGASAAETSGSGSSPFLSPGRNFNTNFNLKSSSSLASTVTATVTAPGMNANAKMSRKEREAQYTSLSSDPKYKKYLQQVDRCLTTFDSMQEWPDFIAFLKQLLKTLQSYPQFKDIPRKLIVAKRLSQCLNPALPSGVHQRALDVYAHVLGVLGPSGLAENLQLYSLGLFPFFEYASTSVKPMLLNLFETRYLPLQGALRPVMRAFILALLPGLEEEGGEWYDKVLSLLDQISGTVSPSFFLQNVWLIMLTATVQRANAISYLAKRLPRLDTEDDVSPILGSDLGLPLRAFASSLEDDNLLVRRGALDLLIQCLPLHGGVMKRASSEDREIVMRAVVGVVLRRDVSLNRRVYAWLLGGSGKEGETVAGGLGLTPGGAGAGAERQMEYLKIHGLELLRTTLKTEMHQPTAGYSPSRPFKIFISLLDKWEIGSLLTDVLVYDALACLKSLLERMRQEGEAGDLVITANALYDAVEPSIVWKQLFTEARKEILAASEGKDTPANDLFIFILKTFRLQDEEVQKMHLPLVYAAVLDLLKKLSYQKPTPTPSIQITVGLAKELQRHISLTGLAHPLKIEPSMPEAISFDFIACHVYGIESETSSTMASPSDNRLIPVPLLETLHYLLDFTDVYVDLLTSSCKDSKPAWTAFTDGMQLLLELVVLVRDGDSVAEPISVRVDVNRDMQRWLQHVLMVLEKQERSFTALARIVDVSVLLNSLDAIQPQIALDRQIVWRLMTALLSYLSATRSAYHVRAVDLIYLLENATEHCYIESIISQSLTSSSSLSSSVNNSCEVAFERFGVLWRLTDDKQQPGFTFKVPMLIVLETLRSGDPRMRRIGEGWMRSNLKSYIRVLDPLFYDLLDPAIHQIQQTNTVKWRQISGYIYTRPFDHNQIAYLFEMLLLLSQFGGQTFNRIASSTVVRQTNNEELADRLMKSGRTSEEATYMDVMADILIRFLQTEPNASLKQSLSHVNIAIQSTTIDLLQNIVSKGDIDISLIDTLEAVVISKLFFMIHTSQLNLQNKLLRLLHSVISASIASRAKEDAASPKSIAPSDSSESRVEGRPTVPAINPFMVQTIIDGIATSSNRPLLQQWLDFVLMSVSQFQQNMSQSVPSFSTCICRQISQLLEELEVIARFQRPSEDLLSSVSDAEIVMLLNALENIVLLGVPTNSASSSFDNTTNEKSSSDNVGLLNLVSNVFSSDSSASENRPLSRTSGNRTLQEVISVLYSVWMTSTQQRDDFTPEMETTMTFVLSRIHFRCCRVLERLFRVQTLEVVETIVECWYRDFQEVKKSDTGFEIIDFLTASAQNVVHLVCESISARITPAAEKGRRMIVNNKLTEAILFIFLEGYLEKLEGPLAVQVWSRYHSLAKEVAANLRDYKQHVFFVLKCLTVLIDKISQTPAIDERRLRRDIQDIFGKLLDACVLISGRSFDQGLWARRNTKDVVNMNGSDSNPQKANSEIKFDEKDGTDSPQITDTKLPFGHDLIGQINEFLATKVLPNMRVYIGDNDKIATACTQIVYYIINPVLRTKTSRPLDLEDVMIQIIEEMSRIPAAVKAWRNPVVDAFNDNKFFALPFSAGQKWAPSIKALFSIDKAVFTDLLGKITSTPSTNIFANKEYEMLLRAFNVRRMSYVILSGEKNQFLTILPAVQEKLVDLLRNVNSPVVESEVYLCVRVLLCRLSPHNLASFWPVLLTELYRVFEQTLLSPPSDGSEELLSILSASKLLDLLLALQSEEFQIHQWMFVTDTVDAIYPPNQWLPEALMDQLAEAVSDLPMSKTKNGANDDGAQILLTTPNTSPFAPDLYSSNVDRTARRPILKRMKQIESIHDLLPFFSHVSVMSYENVYASGGAVDWESIERGLLDDMFDGR